MTYEEYLAAWQYSTESRDLAFDEWLMLLLDRKEGEMTNEMRKLNEEWEANLAEAKRQRDAYYDELTRLRQERVELIDKACKCFCDVCGYKECAKRNVVCTEYKEFRKAMEEEI